MASRVHTVDRSVLVRNIIKSKRRFNSIAKLSSVLKRAKTRHERQVLLNALFEALLVTPEMTRVYRVEEAIAKIRNPDPPLVIRVKM